MDYSYKREPMVITIKMLLNSVMIINTLVKEKVDGKQGKIKMFATMN